MVIVVFSYDFDFVGDLSVWGLLLEGVFSFHKEFLLPLVPVEGVDHVRVRWEWLVETGDGRLNWSS